MEEQHRRAAALRAVILARIDVLGQAEAARRVAPLWGWAPRDAETRLSRWRKDPGGSGFKDMGSTALLELLVALDLGIASEPTCAKS